MSEGEWEWEVVGGGWWWRCQDYDDVVVTLASSECVRAIDGGGEMVTIPR